MVIIIKPLQMRLEKANMYLDWHPVFCGDELLRFIVEQGEVVEQAQPGDEHCHHHHHHHHQWRLKNITFSFECHQKSQF